MPLKRSRIVPWRLSEVANLADNDSRTQMLERPRCSAQERGLAQAGAKGFATRGWSHYKAAQSKNQDTQFLMLPMSITTACANCHEKYRDTPNLADRCM